MKRFYAALACLACVATAACGGANDSIHDAGSAPADSGQGGFDAGGGPTGDSGSNATCGAPVACGAAGVTYEECTTAGADGQCAAIVYQVSDGRSFTCATCASCSAAQQQLSGYCGSQPDGGSVDAAGPEAGGDSGQEQTTCLTPVACGAGGLTYSECTTTEHGGACGSIAYRVSNGSVYTCASCGDCTSAIEQLDTFCADQGPPVTSCTAAAPCESSPLTYQTCTTSLDGNCQSTSYQTSDGQTFACAACGNCGAALQSLDAYCTAQTPPLTTCGPPVACGIGGATYDLCTTAQGAQCDSAGYQTSTGESFACSSCTSCVSALTSIETYCASLTALGGVVMFGGFDSTGTGLSDTWLWDGSTWTSSAATGPSGRGDPAGAMQGGRLVVFGGTSSSTVTASYGDTWAWTGTGWSELATTGPSVRFGSAVASWGNDILLFGGDDSDAVTTNLSDTWLWNGSEWSSTTATGPSARVGASAATLDGQVVVFGGADVTGAYLGDTWIFDGTEWTEPTLATSPPARYYASMSTLGAQIVLFGGVDSGDYLADTWSWNGSAWTQLTPAASPPARAGGAATTWNGGIVLFGGNTDTAYYLDTWVWNGSTWLAQTATGPGSRSGAAMGTY
jgi:hypothetical protein